MSFPKNFLMALAKEKDLTSKETEVFLALFGDDKSRVQITQELAISDSALGTRLTGIYNKFNITGSGPVKESRLKDYLTDRYRRWKPADLGNCSVDSDVEQDIDALVREVRSRCCEAILDSYSKIRLLDDTRINVDLLYVDVYVLEKLSSKRYASISGLLEGVEQREDYERLALGQRQKRLPGQEIVRQFPRLMVLGKPGSGKTTFLRHLAVDCSNGKFFCNRIPVLLELRSIKEGNSFNLLNQIHREFGLAEQGQTQQILNQGKAFILLDGLDEVPCQVRQSVRDQIYDFAKEYRKNRFVLTCRTQTIEYIADNFEPIEVADFDAEQVTTFVHNWFTAIPETSGVAEGWTSRFVNKLRENTQIRELAVTPILLSLTCLLFTAEQDLPKKRSELYEKGIDLLLKQWDRFREIPRDYQQLSISDKQKLLSYLAFRKFEQPSNFILFEPNEIQGYIAEHLRIDAEESEAVLKAIEAHHGLLIERAQGIWSFSHLTFQEYFIARKIVATCNPYATDDPILQELVSHITEKRWREVFLLAVGMLDSADTLLRLMKARIDELLAEDEKLQQFLKWVDKKAQPFEDAHKPSVRAFYFALDPAFERSCIYPLNFAFKDKIDLDHFLAKTLDRFNRIFRFRIFAYVHFRSLGADLDYDLYCALKHVQDCKLRRKLQKLRAKLPVTPFETKAQSYQAYLESITEEEENFKQWWQRNGQAWVEQLRAVMIEHRNIGHNWQFSDEQKELLQQYYDANKLLVDCLNSDCDVNREVRHEIEQTLLLPIPEIEKRTEL